MEVLHLQVARLVDGTFFVIEVCPDQFLLKDSRFIIASMNWIAGELVSV